MSLLKDIAYKLFMPSKNVGQVLDVLRGEHKLRRLLKQLISHEEILRAVIIICEDSGEALRTGKPLYYRAWMEDHHRDIEPVIQFFSEKQPVNGDIISILIACLSGENVETGLETVMTGSYRGIMAMSDTKVLRVNLIGFVGKKNRPSKIFLLVLSLTNSLPPESLVLLDVLELTRLLQKEMYLQLGKEFSFR